MAKAFRRRRDGSIVGALHVHEVELLRSLLGQLIELVADEQPVVESEDLLSAVLDLASPEPPEDPVLRRLLPDAYAADSEQDLEAARDFRRYTERGLRQQKREHAQRVLDGLASAEEARLETRRVRLSEQDADAWMRALTDLRLALGIRLEVQDGDERTWQQLSSDDPRRYVHQIYDWLGWLQETLVTARLPPPRASIS